jgi:hypothetical protein
LLVAGAASEKLIDEPHSLVSRDKSLKSHKTAKENPWNFFGKACKSLEFPWKSSQAPAQ